MLRDILFYSLYILPLLILYLYRNRLGARCFQVGSANLLMFFYIVVNHVGLIMFYHAEKGLKQLAVVDKSIVVMMAGITSLVVLAFLIADSLMRQIHSNYRLVNINNVKQQRLNFFPLMLLIGFTGFIATAKFLDNSPLQMMLTGHLDMANEARVSDFSSNHTFLGIKPSYLKIFFEMASFVSILFLVKFMATKKKRYCVLYAVAVLIVMIESMTNVSKGALLTPVYQIWVVYALLYTKAQVLNRFVIWALFITVFGVSTISSLMMSNEHIDFFYPFERLFLGNLLPQYVVMNHFNFDNLLWGTSLPTWWSFGNHQQFLIDVFVWKELMGWQPGQPFYTAPSSFVADSFANFHFVGVFAISLIVFLLLRIVDNLLAKVRSDLLYGALLAYSGLHFSYWATGGSLNFIFDYYYYGVLLFALVFYKNYRLR